MTDRPDPTRPDPTRPAEGAVRPLATQLADLAHGNLATLRRHWPARWGSPPPLRSVDLMRALIAWRLQAQALGGLDRTARRQIARTGRLQPEGQALGLGARLRRDWQGRVVEVVVTADGFCWEGRSFPSLSAAARAATGTRWNGPRFFGLRRPVA